MADITIQFPRADYSSLQIGDVGYYAKSENIASSAGFSEHQTDESNFIELGPIKSINKTTSLADGTLTTTIVFDASDSTDLPTVNDFILFSKDNKVNCSSLLGYYGSATFRNSSTNKAEMFSTTCDISESSK